MALSKTFFRLKVVTPSGRWEPNPSGIVCFIVMNAFILVLFIGLVVVFGQVACNASRAQAAKQDVLERKLEAEAKVYDAQAKATEIKLISCELNDQYLKYQSNENTKVARVAEAKK